MSEKQWDRADANINQMGEKTGRYIGEDGNVINLADALGKRLIHLNRSGKIIGYRSVLYDLEDAESFFLNINVAPGKTLIIIERFTPAKGLGNLQIDLYNNTNNISGDGDEKFNLYDGTIAESIESKIETGTVSVGGTKSSIPPSYLFLGDESAISFTRLRTIAELPVTTVERIIDNPDETFKNFAFEFTATGDTSNNVEIKAYVELYFYEIDSE